MGKFTESRRRETARSDQIGVFAHAALRACAGAVVAAASLAPLAGAQTATTKSSSSTQLVSHARTSRASSTDPRWYAWLGCWQSDSLVGTPLKCIVPANGTNTVDELTLANGKIIARDHLDISGRPHAIREQGCEGSESVSWSSSGRRVFLRSDYVCATGIKGTSSRMFAILPGGDWLEVEDVRAGSGSIVHSTRRRDAGIPAGAPSEIATLLGSQQLAVTSARANAATTLTTDDVLEALHASDAPIVRTWLVATNQSFNLSAEQVTSLVHEDVPTSVLQAMMSSVPARQLGVAPMRSAASDDYLNTPVYAPGSANPAVQMGYGVQQLPNGVTCTQFGCVGPMGYQPYNGYSPYNGAGYNPYSSYATYVPYPVYSTPLILRRGHEGFGRSFPTHQVPVSRGPVGRRP